MAHTHSHEHTHGSRGDLKLAFFLNLGFTILEIFGGLFINSIAILSDALHDLGDSLSLGLAWYLQGISEKQSDHRYSYGYRRFSLLGAFINTVVLIGGSLFIVREAIQRLLEPEPFNSPGMVVFAVIGVAVNGLAAYRLRSNTSSNAQVVGLHLLEDVLGWVAVLVVGLVSLVVDLPILDPILSLLITVFILVNAVRRLIDSGKLFLQGVPEDIDINKIQSQLQHIEGVSSLHHTHIWSLDGEHNVFTAHLVVSDDTSAEEIKRIRHESLQLLDGLNLEHVTIAIEYESEECGMR